MTDQRDSAIMRATLATALAGRYTVHEEIGTGGMATVFRAIDLRHDRAVALKVMHPEFAASIGRERFLREIRVTANLAHPHILPLHDSGEAGPLLYYVTPLVQGMSLRGRLQREGRLPVADALRIAREVADGLAHAHARGIVHRDVKPENILLSDYQGEAGNSAWSAVIADFGIAAVRDVAGEDRMTRTGTSLGSALYMSPEQAVGEPVDERTDIWSLGCVVYEMLAGAPPFGRDAKAALAKSLTERPAPIRIARSQSLNGTLSRALARNPAERFVSVSEFARALEQTRRPRQFRALAAAAGVLVLTLAGFFALRLRNNAPRPPEFIQLTNYTDAATAPALSPDGRTVAFLRGRGVFGQSASLSQLYVKQLPDGEAVQLTATSTGKATPVFSPDGSRVAFTASESNFAWSTHVVSANGGSVTELLPNASGLTWIDDGHILFSENRRGIHMGIRSATIARGNIRDVYWPANEMGMAHRSAMSPDRKWVLVAEMDRGIWTPCRLVPADGSSTGEQVGPDGGCTYAAWDPHGRWMYFTSNAGGRYHIWRQRFPKGKPEQLTNGPTEEEGLAIEPDGKSLLTSAGVRLNTIRLLDGAGERQLAEEGFSLLPQASKDGSRVYFIAQTGAARGASYVGRLVVLTLGTGVREELLQGELVAHFDLAADDRTITFVSGSDAPDKKGVWIAPLDRSAAPRRVFDGEVERAFFDPAGSIYFLANEGSSRFIYRLRAPGYVRERVSILPAFNLFAISPDGEWVVVISPFADGHGLREMAVSTRGLPPVLLCSFCTGGGGPARIYAPGVSWTRDGRLLLISGQYVSRQAPLDGPQVTIAIPVQPGRALPPLPVGGVSSIQDYQKIPGARTIPKKDVLPGATPEQLFFYQSTEIRNLYRVQLR